VTGGLFPVLDAGIRLSEESGQGTQVALAASCRPPFGLPGAELDRLLLLQRSHRHYENLAGPRDHRPGRDPR
jgi:hypothetical protein